MSASEFEGGCLCGSTRFRVSGVGTSRCYCHCNSCRRFSGAPFVAWVTFPAEQFRLTGGKLVEYASSEGVVRTFCGVCSTGITYINQRRPDMIDVPLAVLDEPRSLEPEYHIWVSDKPAWVRIHDPLPQFPEWRPSAARPEA